MLFKQVAETNWGDVAIDNNLLYKLSFQQWKGNSHDE